MRKHLVLTLLLAILCGTGASRAEDATDALLRALAPTTHLQGAFLQRQYDEDDKLLLQSAGRFALLRPGYFSWEIESPDDQLIVATPEFVWHYDRDLATVTRRPSPQGAGASPLQILGGDVEALRESFAVEQAGEAAFTLTPRVPDAGFQRLHLGLDGAGLSRMEVLDNLQQRIEIEFSEVDSSSPLTPQDFHFEPPPGVDVFHHDQ